MNGTTKPERERVKGKKITDFFVSNIPSASSDVEKRAPSTQRSDAAPACEPESYAHNAYDDHTFGFSTHSPAEDRATAVIGKRDGTIPKAAARIYPSDTTDRKHIREFSSDSKDPVHGSIKDTFELRNDAVPTPLKRPTKRQRVDITDEIIPSSQSDEMEDDCTRTLYMGSSLGSTQEHAPSPRTPKKSSSKHPEFHATPLPPTPKLMTIAEKTAQIKAQVLAEIALQPSPQSVIKRDFQLDLEISSDDEMDDIFAYNLPKRKNASVSLLFLMSFASVA